MNYGYMVNSWFLYVLIPNCIFRNNSRKISSLFLLSSVKIIFEPTSGFLKSWRKFKKGKYFGSNETD